MSAEIIKFGGIPSEASKQKKSPADYQKNLQEVIDTVRSAKNKLGKITLHMEAEFPDAGALGEALKHWMIPLTSWKTPSMISSETRRYKYG